MRARRFEVLGREKDYDLIPSSLDAFEYVQSGEVDATQLLDRATVSLHCFDRDGANAVFVETDEPIDPRVEPFYFLAQYHRARALYLVPIETFHSLAARIPLREDRISFVQSVGRCGSTLVSKIFAAIPEVRSYSEPDAFFQLLQLRGAGRFSDEELIRLVDSCVRWTLRPGLDDTSVEYWSIKFRSQCTEMCRYYSIAFPGSRHLFLYRDPLSWLGSAYRAFVDHERCDEPEYRRDLEEGFAGIHPVFIEFRNPNSPMPVSQTWLLSWIAVVESFLKSRGEGMDWGVATFDQITRSPKPTIQRLLAHCGIWIRDWTDVEAVLSEDSQEGSPVAKLKIKEAQTLPADQLENARRIISQRALLRTITETFPA